MLISYLQSTIVGFRLQRFFGGNMRTGYRSLPFVVSSLAVATCTFCLPAPARAQTATPAANTQGPAQLETIVVTARRREELAFDVPASVTAISGEALQTTGITSINDIIAYVPNANMTENPRGFDTYISIRGMRQADVGATPNFGMYRNGIFAGGHRVNLGSQIDVSRLEVVRGPQGGLYGREAVGGAVNIVYAMPAPGDKLGGYATAGVESDERVRFEGAVTAPINEKIATRTTAWYIDQNGGEYYNQYLREEIDRSSDKGARFSTAASLTSAVDLDLTFEYQKASGPSLRVYAPDGIPNGYAVAPPYKPGNVQQDTPSRNDIEQFYAAGKLVWKTSAGDFSLMTSYRDYQLDGIQDQDMTALPLDTAPLVLQQILNRGEDIKQYYIEALWESDASKPLSWRVGASYFNEEFDLTQMFSTTLDTAMIGYPFGVIDGKAGIPFPGSSTGVDSYSAFADMRYEVSDKLALTATLRYTEDRETLHWDQGIDPSSHPVGILLFSSVVPTFTLDEKDTYDFTSPSIGVEYSVNPDVNVYALYSTGYRPGGYNTTVTDEAYIPYDQESARNYEAGIKTRFLDGRAGMNLTVFHMDQEDLVVQQDDPVDTQFGFTYLANVGEARTNGVEFETYANLGSDVAATFTVGYLDAEYTEGTINAGTPAAFDISGKELQGVRPWTINARVDYSHPLTDSMEFFGDVAVRWENGGAIGDHSEYPLEDTTKLDLSAGLSFSEKTKLTAFVRNATDDKVVQFRFTNGAVGTNLGRRYGAQISHQF